PVTPLASETRENELPVKIREICIYKRPRCCHSIRFSPLRMTARERVSPLLRNPAPTSMKTIAPSLRRNFLLQALVLVTLTPGLILYPVPVAANPAGPDIVAGNVNFQGLGTPQLDINNLTNGGNGRAIINWQSFSIDAGEVTRINQGAGGFTLNRVTGSNASAIYGQLKASQGGVAVINPNG